MLQLLYGFGMAFGLSAALTWAIRVVAQRVGFVSKPRETRWNTRTVALGGGIAMMGVALATFAWVDWALFLKVGPAITLVFLMGVADDLKGLPPIGKLVIQVIAAVWVTQQGFLIPLEWKFLAIPVTILWLVGMSNSINMLDNMDGLSAGVAAIGALAFGVLLATSGQMAPAGLAFAFAGACLGFLVHNFNPARIFMGDAGSLSLGFTLGLLAIFPRIEAPGLPAWLSMSMGFLVLSVPLLDTGLVMAARVFAKRSVMSGGRDHSSHRLVQLGMTDRRAVLVLYGVAALGCLAAWVVSHGDGALLLMVGLPYALILALGWVYLLQIDVVYPEMESNGKKAAAVALRRTRVPLTLLYFVEICMDVVGIALAWVLAHALRFPEEDWGNLGGYMAGSAIPRLPNVILVKIVCLLVFRLYRGVWRTVSTHDVYRIFQAVAIASVILVLGSFFKTRWTDLSRLVIGIDWLLTFAIILGIRSAYSLLRRWSRKLAAKPFRAVWLGPPGVLPMLKKALWNDPSQVLVGAVTPDGRGASEVGVLGAVTELEEIIGKNTIDVVYMEPDGLEPVRLDELRARGITVREVRLQVV